MKTALPIQGVEMEQRDIFIVLTLHHIDKAGHLSFVTAMNLYLEGSWQMRSKRFNLRIS